MTFIFIFIFFFGVEIGMSFPILAQPFAIKAQCADVIIVKFNSLARINSFRLLHLVLLRVDWNILLIILEDENS
jgi:hypothetical protein